MGNNVTKLSAILVLAAMGIAANPAYATYACNAGESVQACMARMAREQSNRTPHPTTNNPGSNGAGQGAGSCNWLSAAQYAQAINQRRGTRCGTSDSFELDVQNTSNRRLKIIVYLKDNRGHWMKEADGTFDNGVAPGQRINQYICNSGGFYKVVAMTLDDFLANHCTYPDYHGY